MKQPDVVLIDLDGTITDSIPGILRCLRIALPVIGLEHISDDELQTWLGPPLRVTILERYGRSEEQLEEFVAAYRANYFGDGEYEFTLFPGMEQFVRDVAASDIKLVLQTAKPIESAQRVLTRADLIDCFEFVSGTELDLMRQDKPSVIRHGLEAIGLDPDTTTAVVIGDRKEDVLGARHFGFTSIAVTWGYAEGDELADVAPDFVATDTATLREVIGLPNGPI